MPRGFTSSELINADSSGGEIHVAADEAVAPGVADVVVVTEELNVPFVVRTADEDHGPFERPGEVELPSAGDLRACRGGFEFERSFRASSDG